MSPKLTGKGTFYRIHTTKVGCEQFNFHVYLDAKEEDCPDKYRIMSSYYDVVGFFSDWDSAKWFYDLVVKKGCEEIS